MTLIKLKHASPANRSFTGINELFNGLFENSVHHDFRSWKSPAANIVASEKSYELQLAAPGLNKDDFKINIEGDNLVVSAEVKSEETDSKFTHREFRFNSFSRSFTLPDDINPEDIKANYENGVLKLTLPRVEEKSKAREIKIS